MAEEERKTISTGIVLVCPACGHDFRRRYVPAGALNDARAELEDARVDMNLASERLMEAIRVRPDAAVRDWLDHALHGVLGSLS